jgi:uncharacterized membrane protein YdcZ (DUF606 family)
MAGVKSVVVDSVIIFVSFVVGCMMVVQANMNINLGISLGSAIRGSCFSSWIGFIFVSFIIKWYHKNERCGFTLIPAAAISPTIRGYVKVLIATHSPTIN